MERRADLWRPGEREIHVARQSAEVSGECGGWAETVLVQDVHHQRQEVVELLVAQDHLGVGRWR
jgi:hypothetical protein